MTQIGIPSSPPTELTAFERIEEYRAVMDNLAQYSNRRLTTNAVFVGFNTVSLTALGALLVTTKVASWHIIAELVTTSLIIIPINLMWRTALVKYREGLELRYRYLRKLEDELNLHPATTQGQQPTPDSSGLIHILHQQIPKGGFRHRHTAVELSLAWYFIALYPCITLIAAVVTFLSAQGILPPLP